MYIDEISYTDQGNLFCRIFKGTSMKTKVNINLNVGQGHTDSLDTRKIIRIQDTKDESLVWKQPTSHKSNTHNISYDDY